MLNAVGRGVDHLGLRRPATAKALPVYVQQPTYLRTDGAAGRCQLPTSGKAPLTTPVTIAWVSDRVNELKKDDVGLIAPLGAERPRAHWLLNKSCGTPAAAKT